MKSFFIGVYLLIIPEKCGKRSVVKGKSNILRIRDKPPLMRSIKGGGPAELVEGFLYNPAANVVGTGIKGIPFISIK